MFRQWAIGVEFEGASGACARVPYAKRIPPNARAGALPTVERNGFVFAWHHPEGKAPTFEFTRRRFLFVDRDPESGRLRTSNYRVADDERFADLCSRPMAERRANTADLADLEFCGTGARGKKMGSKPVQRITLEAPS